MKAARAPAQLFEKGSLGGTPVKYRARAHIFSQGDPADAAYYVRQGAVKYEARSGKGKKAIIAIFNPGDFFGVGCVAGYPNHLATATAITDCSLIKFQAPQMIRLLQERPSLSRYFTNYLLSRVGRYQEDLIDLRLNTSERRLARVLLLLAEFKEKSRTKRIIPRLHQQDLAEMVGTTRSRVNHFMNRFRKLGLIDYERDIKVHRGLRDLIDLT